MSGASAQLRLDVNEVRDRADLAEVCAKEGVIFKKMSGNLVACCPFHSERTGSFTIHRNKPQWAKCYGCGWSGGVIDFWMASRGVPFKEALEQLASLVGVRPSLAGVAWSAPKARVTSPPTRGLAGKEKPHLPAFRHLTASEVGALAQLRGLSSDGIATASRLKRVGYCRWPQWERLGRHGAWDIADGAPGCWVVTDSARWVAQFRRLDGRPFDKGKNAPPDAKPIKSWTKGSPSWPLGASEIGDRREVLLVEGGADMLAAYHFLHAFGLVDRVAVVAMLGASCAIAPEARGYFNGRRVRIMMDHDEPKARPRGEAIRPGHEAAARWSEQLRNSGAAVECFDLGGLVTATGAAVKDLNDLALCGPEVWEGADGDELRDAFLNFEF